MLLLVQLVLVLSMASKHACWGFTHTNSRNTLRTAPQPLSYFGSSTSSVLCSSQTSSDAEAATIFPGTVKWFDTKKGFGFLTRDSDGEDFFVHQSVIQADGFRDLTDAAAVEFQLATNPETGKVNAIMVTGPDGVPLSRCSWNRAKSQRRRGPWKSKEAVREQKLARGFAFKQRETDDDGPTADAAAA